MNEVKRVLRLLVPNHGFSNCVVVYSPPKVGEGEQYQIHEVTQLFGDETENKVLDLDVMCRMNDVHRQIVLQTQAEFAEKELGIDLTAKQPEPLPKKRKVSGAKTLSIFNE